MKLHAEKFKWVLGLAILTQVGCNGGRGRQQGQYLYPNVATQQQDHNVAGNAFGQSNSGRPQDSGFTNFLRTVARGNPNTIPQDQKDPSQDPTIDPSKKDESKGGTNVDPNNGKAQAVKGAVVSFDEAKAWETYCQYLGANTEIGDDNDKDGDGITDDCEVLLSNKEILKANLELLEKDKVDNAPDPSKVEKVDINATVQKMYMSGLDKDVFNGALVATKALYKEKGVIFGMGCSHDTDVWQDTLCLLEKTDLTGTGVMVSEKKLWKEYAESGGLGEDSDTRLDKQVIRKFGAHKRTRGNDVRSIRDLFQIEQKKYIEADESSYRSFLPSDGEMDPTKIKIPGLEKITVAEKFAAVTGDIPFSLASSGSSVANLTGVQQDTETYRKDAGFIYAAETNLIFPSSSIEVRIGRLMKETDNKYVMATGKPAGIFMLNVGGNTKTVSSHMISKKGEEWSGQEGNKIKPTPRCQSAHVVLVYVADEKTHEDMEGQAIFAENLFYRIDENDTWKPIPQQMMSLKARGGKDCTVDESNVLFTEALDTFKQVVRKGAAETKIEAK